MFNTVVFVTGLIRLIHSLELCAHMYKYIMAMATFGEQIPIRGYHSYTFSRYNVRLALLISSYMCIAC